MKILYIIQQKFLPKLVLFLSSFFKKKQTNFLLLASLETGMNEILQASNQLDVIENNLSNSNQEIVKYSISLMVQLCSLEKYLHTLATNQKVFSFFLKMKISSFHFVSFFFSRCSLLLQIISLLLIIKLLHYHLLFFQMYYIVKIIFKSKIKFMMKFSFKFSSYLLERKKNFKKTSPLSV